MIIILGARKQNCDCNINNFKERNEEKHDLEEEKNHKRYDVEIYSNFFC